MLKDYNNEYLQPKHTLLSHFCYAVQYN